VSDSFITDLDAAETTVVAGHLAPQALAKATRRAVTRALAEDLGDRGDLTSRATVPASLLGEAEIVARAPGVISGLAAVVETFAAVDPRIEVEVHVADGDRVIEDQVIAVVTGPMRALLAGERTALNFLGHLSGVATATANLQDLIEGTGCTIRDTRKTTPGLRLLEKAAVMDGGGGNHRLGLYDAILVKENHIVAAGDVKTAVENLRRANPAVAVQIEVESVEQIWQLLELDITDILLDNFSVEQVRHAASRVDGRAHLEVSGNLDADSVRAYAEAVGPGGRLAVGAITHSALQLDVALDVVETRPGNPLARLSRSQAPSPADADTAQSRDLFGGPSQGASVDGLAAPAADGTDGADDTGRGSSVGEVWGELSADDGARASSWRSSPFRHRRQRGD
jgi:nicotinate-nucleotide pyrophosphorylase (carboxylating)